MGFTVSNDRKRAAFARFFNPNLHLSEPLEYIIPVSPPRKRLVRNQ
jgi:hypothetical protein